MPLLPLRLDDLLNGIGIAEIDAVSQAHIVRACRDKALIHSMMAEIALERCLAPFVEADGIVGTCFDALFTSRARVGIEDDDAVLSL